MQPKVGHPCLLSQWLSLSLCKKYSLVPKVDLLWKQVDYSVQHKRAKVLPDEHCGPSNLHPAAILSVDHFVHGILLHKTLRHARSGFLVSHLGSQVLKDHHGAISKVKV